jgi:hypothetical protein
MDLEKTIHTYPWWFKGIEKKNLSHEHNRDTIL